MGFSEKVQADALVACGRCCCICHKFCGTKIALHHIKQKAYGGDDSFDNCIPLCLDCHEDMGKADPHHVTGKHYSEMELRLHRDTWYKKCSDVAYGANDKTCDEDKQLFNRICQVFSGEAGDSLLHDDLRSIHGRHTFREVYRLKEDLKNPFNEFLNAELDKLRADLLEKMYEFTWHLSMKTFPVGKWAPNQQATNLWLLHNGYTPKSEILSNDYVELEKQFEREADQLNESASNLWNSYCQFVRQGRHIINR